MKKSIKNKTVVTPLPVLIVATYDENGTPDAMNAAWGGQCDYHKIALNLANGHKTTENIRKNREFTVSIGTLDTMTLSDYVGIVSANKIIDKLAKADVHVSKAPNVNAPIIEEYPLTMECRAISINEENGGTRVVGEVVNLLAEESILDEKGNVDFDKLCPISYDSERHTYRVLGSNVGHAFSDGKKLI